MTLQEKIASFTPVKYNQFYWWRRFKSREILSHRSTLYDKIKNGDYEMSDYFYQAKWEKVLMEEKIANIADPNEKHEVMGLSMERHRRLMTDYEKDEEKIMTTLKKDFRSVFGVSEEELERYMENCEGTLIDLYNMIKQDYIKKYPDKASVYAMEN